MKKKSTKKTVRPSLPRKLHPEVVGIIDALNVARAELDAATIECRMRRQAERTAFVTVEGVRLETIGSAELEGVAIGFLDPERLTRHRTTEVRRVVPFAVTKAVHVPHSDTRTTVRFQFDMGKVRIDCVRVVGAALLDQVRCGMSQPLPCNEYSGQAIVLIGRVLELGMLLQVDVKAFGV